MKRVLVLLFLLVFTFSNWVPLQATHAEETGGIFRWGFAPPDSLNPFVAVNEASIILQRSNYESLVDYDESFNYVPYLAEKWESSNDGLVWTFQITDKSKWHDGKPLTSKDVKFTIDFIKSNKLGLFNSYVSDIQNVETPDNKTVVIKLQKPISTMLYNMRNLIVLPEHIWAGMNKDAAYAAKNDPVIGSGPFKFVEWKKGQYVKMETVKDYWRGRAKIDTLILKELTNDEAGVNALKSGELDGIRTVPANLIAELEKQQGIKVVAHKSFWYNHFAINGFLNGGMGNPLLKDKALRLAIAHAINKKSLTETIYYGHATPGVGIISPANEHWFNTNIAQYDFDLEKAKKILDDAGYKDTDGDGIREKGGKKLQFRFNVMNESAQYRAAQQLADWLKQIGISTTPIQTEDLGALIYRDNDKNGVSDHDYDFLIWSWSGDPDPSFNLLAMLSSQIGNWQDVGYSNKEYDDLYAAQAGETKEAERKKMVDRMQEIGYLDVPYIILYYPERIQAYRSDKWEGLVPMVDGFVSKLNIRTLMQVRQIPKNTGSTSVSSSNNSAVPAMANNTQNNNQSSTSSYVWAGIGVLIIAIIVILRRRNREND